MIFIFISNNLLSTEDNYLLKDNLNITHINYMLGIFKFMYMHIIINCIYVLYIIIVYCTYVCIVYIYIHIHVQNIQSKVVIRIFRR